ncbi:hypothetical protein Bca52824_054873 [Brassica carinata]|uniref:Uncharacterized protein n=1 Tax=Brassica carinata TaxID=52824 RepID=A0A8X7RBD8_BRACI|nr:hypothetical protein Bca52824_054873 [Brassica carinata]
MGNPDTPEEIRLAPKYTSAEDILKDLSHRCGRRTDPISHTDMEVPMSTIITFQSLVKAVVVRVDTLAALLTCLQRRHPLRNATGFNHYIKDHNFLDGGLIKDISHEKKHMKQFLIKECRRCFGTSPKRANELLRNMARVEIPIIIMQQLVTGVSSVYDYERILHYRTSLWEHQQGVLNEMS